MSKKIIAIILAVVMLVAVLAACGGGNSTPSNNTPSNNTPADNGKKDEGKKDEGKDSEPAKEEYTEKYVVRVGIMDPKPSIYYDTLIEPWEKAVTEYSNGRITFEDYASGAICGMGSGLDAIRTGTIDVAQDAFAFYTGVYPYCELVNMCGVRCKSLQAFNNMMPDYTKAFPESMDEEFYVLGRYVPCYMAWILTDKFVESMSDLKGLTIRATGSAMSFVNGTGAVGTMVASPDIFESIKLHVIDGAFFSIGGTNTFGIYEVAHYATTHPYYFPENSVSMSRELYNSMDPEAQAIFDKSRDDFREAANNYSACADPDALKMIEEAGAEFYVEEMNEKCAAEMLEVADQLMKEKAAEMDAAGLDGTGALEWLNVNAPKY
ncbi:MAG: TRAP transporter substrate-binding protein DctP [Oscillospiraceae bacterium]|nr:TRAP transporter substrate-binding protein DctP [Oscillospiraceae bacterium]